jgi:hypothetical protein
VAGIGTCTRFNPRGNWTKEELPESFRLNEWTAKVLKTSGVATGKRLDGQQVPNRTRLIQALHRLVLTYDAQASHGADIKQSP